MNEIVAEAIFDLWSDDKIVAPNNVDIFEKKNEVAQIIWKHFKSEVSKDFVFIDEELTDLVLNAEKNAFMQGIQIGYDLGVGKLG